MRLELDGTVNCDRILVMRLLLSCDTVVQCRDGLGGGLNAVDMHVFVSECLSKALHVESHRPLCPWCPKRCLFSCCLKSP